MYCTGPDAFFVIVLVTSAELAQLPYLDLEVGMHGTIEEVSLRHDEFDPHAQS